MSTYTTDTTNLVVGENRLEIEAGVGWTPIGSTNMVMVIHPLRVLTLTVSATDDIPNDAGNGYDTGGEIYVETTSDTLYIKRKPEKQHVKVDLKG